MTRVSIQMCTYNRAKYIEQAIESVFDQTFQDWELIVLDDASTDNTEEIIKKYTDKDNRVKYFKNNLNIGISKNRNKSLSLSNGEYVAVLDSDDYWIDKNKLEKQVDFLDKHPDYCLVGTHFIKFDKESVFTKFKKKQYPLNNFILRKVLLLTNLFCHSATMYRRKEVINIGGYDNSLPIWEDYDLWLRIGILFKFANLNMYGTMYRVHKQQSNKDKQEICHLSQQMIIDKYKNDYNYYYFANFLNKLRNWINK